jgi:hypothetical protein
MRLHVIVAGMVGARLLPVQCSRWQFEEHAPIVCSTCGALLLPMAFGEDAPP